VDIAERLGGVSTPAAVVISVAVMLFAGFLMTRLTKLAHLPNVTAYILTGILLGPFALDLIPPGVVEGMEFLSDIALAFIAFGSGQFFSLPALRRNGGKVLVITLLESLAASALVFLLGYRLLGLPLAFAAVLSALAAATAPASTLMTIRQTGAHGDFVDTLLQVVALDDAVGLLAYSAAIAVALGSLGGAAFRLRDVLLPVAVNLGVLLLGGVFGLFLKLLIRKKRTTDNRLIITLALLFAFCGVCSLLGISPLLGCMSMGMTYRNLAKDESLFKQMNYFSPPVLQLFFVRSGILFDLGALTRPMGEMGGVPLMAVGVLYFAVRILGKYGGAWLGCLAVGKEKRTRRYLGLALIPQAGVAIGLAALGARTLGPALGNPLRTIILASSVLYELVGPGCAKLALWLSGSYSNQLEELAPIPETGPDGGKKTEVELLIERIREIRKQLPAHSVSEDEREFDRAAEEFYEAWHSRRQRRGIWR
jgi:Kef-type K+ transport system membrane component KefB